MFSSEPPYWYNFDMKSFATMLETFLKDKKMKKILLSEKLNVDPSYVSQMLSGKALPTYEMLLNIIQVLNLKDDELQPFVASCLNEKYGSSKILKDIKRIQDLLGKMDGGMGFSDMEKDLVVGESVESEDEALLIQSYRKLPDRLKSSVRDIISSMI